MSSRKEELRKVRALHREEESKSFIVIKMNRKDVSLISMMHPFIVFIVNN